jgi:hypothetical protein
MPANQPPLRIISRPLANGFCRGSLGLPGGTHATFSLDSNVVPGVPQSITGGIYGGQQQIAALAFRWYPKDWVRSVPQFQHTNVTS